MLMVKHYSCKIQCYAWFYHFSAMSDLLSPFQLYCTVHIFVLTVWVKWSSTFIILIRTVYITIWWHRYYLFTITHHPLRSAYQPRPRILWKLGRLSFINLGLIFHLGLYNSLSIPTWKCWLAVLYSPYDPGSCFYLRSGSALRSYSSHTLTGL